MKQVQQHDRQNPPNFLVMYYDSHTCNLAMLQNRHILPETGSIEQTEGHQSAVYMSMSPIIPDLIYPMWTGDVTMPDCDSSGFVSTSSSCPPSELPWGWEFHPFD